MGSCLLDDHDAPFAGEAVVPAIPVGPMPSLVGWTAWPAPGAGQTYVAWGGVPHSGTWADHCRWLEAEHAGPVHPKGRSPHYAMVATTDGHRCNASIQAVAAVHYDYDDGEHGWDALLARLDAAGIAYLAYESGGAAPGKPKWHITFPLAVPYVPSAAGPDAARQWRRLYHAGRVMLGQLAGFLDPVEHGYDPAPCALSSAIYPGYRRTDDTPVRRVVWRDGLALDGAALARIADAGAARPRQGGGGASDPFRSFSLTGAGTGTDRKRTPLPADTLITLCDGPRRRSVAFGDVAGHSHCLCPKHGGSGRGSAWVDVTPAGPRLHCGPCGTTWSPAATEAERASIDAEIDSLVAGLPSTDIVALRDAELAEARAEADAARAPVAQFGDRVAARYVAATPYEASEDIIPAGDGPQVAREALVCVRRAKARARVLRASQPYTPRHSVCGRLAQGLVDYHTGRRLFHGRGCGRDDCSWCAPYRIALRAGAAIYTSPVAEYEDQLRVLAPPLVERGAYVYRMAATVLSAWQRSWRRQAQTSVQAALGIASGRNLGNNLEGRETSTEISTTQPKQHDVMVVFQTPGSAGVTVLSSCPVTRRGKSSAPGWLVGEDLVARVETLEAACYQIEENVPGFRRVATHPMPDSGQIPECILGSQRLHLCPETVYRRSRPHGWCVERTDVLHPARAARALAAAGISFEATEAEDGVRASVLLGPRTDEEWQRIWGIVRYVAEDSDPEAIEEAPSESQEATVAHAPTEEQEPEATETHDGLWEALVASLDTDDDLTATQQAILERVAEGLRPRAQVPTPVASTTEAGITDTEAGDIDEALAELLDHTRPGLQAVEIHGQRVAVAGGER